jgi:hypothetical protein
MQFLLLSSTLTIYNINFLFQAPFFQGLFLTSVNSLSTVPFPKYTISITLDGLVGVSKQETLGGKEAVVGVEFYATILAM